MSPRPICLLALLLVGCPTTEEPELITCFYDGDGDGYGTSTTFEFEGEACSEHAEGADVGGDCDDSADWIHPDAEDAVGDGFDGDCVGGDRVECPVDADGDGFTEGDVVEVDAGDCTDPPFEGDCDDGDATSYPYADEIPGDGIDQDCNGVDAVNCYYDGDGDGHGIAEPSVVLDGICGDDEFEAPVGDDCDDSSPDTHPGAEDLPGDGFDSDCSGADTVECLVDGDGDGYTGDEVVVIDWTECDATLPPGDCADDDAGVHPTADEIADDGIDQDCTGADTITCFYDGDEDGYGTTPFTTEEACADLALAAAVDGDCDDALDWISPGVVEVCDGFDDDCDGTIDTGQEHVQTSFPFALPAAPVLWGAFTVEVRWLFEPPEDEDVTLFAIEDGGDFKLGLYTAGDAIWSLDTDVEPHSFAAPPDTDTESGHLALVSDGAELRVLWNGVVLTTWTPTTAPTWSASADLTFLTEYPDGVEGTTASHYEELRVWTRALADSEIAAGQCSLPTIPDADLAAWLPMDGDFTEASGSGQVVTEPESWNAMSWQL